MEQRLAEILTEKALEPQKRQHRGDTRRALFHVL